MTVDAAAWSLLDGGGRWEVLGGGVWPVGWFGWWWLSGVETGVGLAMMAVCGVHRF